MEWTSPAMCPLCRETFQSYGGLRSHLGETHDLFDDEDAPPPVGMVAAPVFAEEPSAIGNGPAPFEGGPAPAQERRRKARLGPMIFIAVGLLLILAAVVPR